jgi:RTX calcium-binding nonapeptide repeat (4 copies)
VRGKHQRAGVIMPLLLALSLGPALSVLAHTPSAHRQFSPSHFNGTNDHVTHGPDTDADGNPAETSEAQVAGDLFDGIDQLYTVRTVADTQTRFYEWYECPGTQVFDPNLCRRLARDDSPTLSSPPPGVAQVAAFEATFDIAPPLPEGVRRFTAMACIEETAPRGHCRFDNTGVHFDNSGSVTDHPATESGQILRPIHGQAVANTGFTALAFTSETDLGRILFCLDVGTSPTTESSASPAAGCDQGSSADQVPDDSPACDIQFPPGADCWSANIDPPDNIEFSLSIIEQDDPTAPVSSGTGECEEDTQVGGDGVNGGDDCQFDKIYLTSLVNPPPPPPAPWPFPGQPPPAVTGKCPDLERKAGNHIFGGDGDDTLRGTPDADVICGLSGDDTLRALGGNDLVLGGDGDDRIAGGGGSDRLRGEKDADSLRGGRGRDSLSGGPGRDLLSGGAGRDRCAGGVTRGCEG